MPRKDIFGPKGDPAKRARLKPLPVANPDLTIVPDPDYVPF
jgi:hypothetical protein